MGVKRVQMAAEAGANVIVTACPFCMVNIEDAIKVAGMEGKMTAIDLAELVDKQMVQPRSDSNGTSVFGRLNVEILVCAEEYPTLRKTRLSSTARETTSNATTWSIRSTNRTTTRSKKPCRSSPKSGGNVTVVTVGGEDDEEILRREMAMGANHGVLISDEPSPDRTARASPPS